MRIKPNPVNALSPFQMQALHRAMRFSKYGLMRWEPAATVKRQRTEPGGSLPALASPRDKPRGWPGDPACQPGDDPFGAGGVWLKVRACHEVGA